VQQEAADSDFTEDAAAAPALAPDRSLPLWPWLLAAMALGAGGAFLFWRNRGRHSYAGGPHIDAFVAPEPAPRGRVPAPAPRPAPTQPTPSSPGLVTTRLRPWLDIAFAPKRCIIEEHQVVFEFELTVYNSGSGAARDVLVEAVMINASPTQEQEINAFFARTGGAGERIERIAQLKRVALSPRVAVPRQQVRVLEAGGRRVFVPLIAFNVQYNWGASNSSQTSAVYLLGRETKAEKLAPFRIDLGARVYRGIEARPLPNTIRN
jgi:hypothetical protein